MDGDNKMDNSLSDDEDLEALRLAALESLKKKAVERDNSGLSDTAQLKMHNFNNPTGKRLRKRGRYFPNHPNRKPENGQFPKGQYSRIPGQYNSRVRNTNLISITPIQAAEEKAVTKSSSDVPKLILPQDRYSKTAPQPEKIEGPISKFDRYDNSESESEEDDDDAIETESAAEGSLKRSNSLEELMKELEDEIQGESRSKETKSVKNKVKRKKSNASESINEGTSIVSKDIATDDKKSGVTAEKTEKPVKTKIIETPVNLEITEKSAKEGNEKKPIEQKVQPKKSLEIKTSPSNKYSSDDEIKHYSPIKNKQHNRSPIHRKTDYHRKVNRNYSQSFSQPPIPQSTVFASRTPPYLPYTNTIPAVNPVYLPGFIPTNIPPPTGVRVPPVNFVQSPLSPLTINTDTLNTTISAPLSPRSAAFVLENRAIIEKRKRSPRRSYSRSPSPRSRHSSPRRSYTPKRGSLSPKISPRLLRRSLTPKKSPSPRRYSPKRCSRSPRRSLTPVRRLSPLPRRHSPKRPRTQMPASSRGSVYDRLGVKVSSKTELNSTDFKEHDRIVRRSRSRSSTPLKDEKPLEPVDPVLEARRKKFETNEIKNKDGVIRLKPRGDDKEIIKTESTKEPLQPVKTEIQATNKDEKEVDSNAIVSNDKIDEASSKPNEENLIDTKDEDDYKIDGLSDLNEEELLGYDDTLDLSPPVERLLSDEESDPENEGRFKAKVQSDPKVPILPFTKLLNGQKSSEYKENLKFTSSSSKSRTPPKPKDNKRKRTPSPLPERATKTSKEKNINAPTISSKVKDVSNENRYERQLRFAGRLPISSRMKVKIDKPPITTPIENKRIEIKIRNPSKYSKADDDKIQDKGRDENKCVYTSRKVEITKRDESSSESETEILVENEDDTPREAVDRHADGDLRAQLSRKRAERQRRPESERSSRLLHSALDGAVFKKSKKSKKDKEAKKDYQAFRQLLKLEKLKRNMSRAVKAYNKLQFYEHFELCYDPDVKLPIHLRLGIANAADLFSSKKKKSSKKHRKQALEQV